MLFDCYPLLRAILFRMMPEASHRYTLQALDWAYDTGMLRFLCPQIPVEPVILNGLEFKNPVGLAAGLDKNADHFLALSALGFGFVEVGTITPKPQPGNPAPRLFRLESHRAIINRMGFNNQGVEYLLERIKKAQFNGVLGVNIGKNFATPVVHANHDYLYCLRQVYPFADYVVINISSPNTPGLRALQLGDQLTHLLSAIKEAEGSLSTQHQKTVPIFVKISPDMQEDELAVFCEEIVRYQITGVISTNTTLSRKGVENSAFAGEAGGLSGQPLFDLSTKTLSHLKEKLAKHSVTLIGVGGISSPEQAMAKFDNGADLIQLYSGFIYEGPSLIYRIVEAYRLRSRQTKI